MMKEKKQPLQMDERNRGIALQVIAIMYFITITALTFVILYRQLVLGQSIEKFEDFAIILTFNSLFLISALLYFGAIPIRKLKIKTLLLFYLVIVVLGSIFTYAKYNIFQSAGLSLEQLMHKFFILSVISGLIIGFMAIFIFLGNRRLEKEME